MKTIIKKILNRIPFARDVLDPETERLKKLPRFTETKTLLLEKKIRIADAASFLFIKDEVFKQEIYKFNTRNSTPYIIDCGANIGLSIIYFKRLFPDAIIVGFEPDEKIFEILKHNVNVFSFNNTTILKKACWNKETTLEFFSEGADAGRIAIESDKLNITVIPTVSIRKYLQKKVDFLKIDIEGADYEVLQDIKDLLGNVEKIFIEYHSFVGKQQMLSELLTILKEAEFRFIIHHIGTYSAKPFIEVSTYLEMDLQLNIYAYRS